MKLTTYPSTTIISIVRLSSLVQFSQSTNPTFDNVPTAYWSVLEAFVGIFCVCMPALRRCFATLFPQCFGSTQTDSKYEKYDTPNKLSNGKQKTSKGGTSFGRSTFSGSGIRKTTETTVESRTEEEDEIELVNLQSARETSMNEGWTRGIPQAHQGTSIN
jgi:hypothetical protein